MFYTSYINKLRNEFLTYYNENNFSEACKIGNKILSTYKTNKAEDSLRYAQDIYNTACAYNKNLKFKEALNLYDDAKNMLEYITEDDKPYPQCLGDIYTNMGVIYKAVDKSDMALSCFEKAYNIYTNDVDRADLTAKANYNMGSIYYDLQDYNEALFYYKSALSLVEDNCTLYYDILNSMGYCYEKLKDYSQSQNVLETALESIKKIHSLNSEEYLVNINYLSAMLLRCKKYDAAIIWLKKTAAIAKTIFNENHPVYAEILNRLGDAHTAKKEYSMAIMFKTKALNIAINHSNSLNHIAILLQLSDLYKKTNEFDKSADALKQCLNLKKALLGCNSINYIKESIDLADIYISINRDKAAIEVLEALLDNSKMTPLLFQKITDRLVPLYEENGYGKQLYSLYDSYIKFFPEKSFDDMLSTDQN